MIYANHNLKIQLQEWENRLRKSTYYQIDNQLSFLLKNLESYRQLSGILREITDLFPYTNDDIERLIKEQRINKQNFVSQKHQASFCYLFVKYIAQKERRGAITDFIIFGADNFETKKVNLIENYASPLFYYLQDCLDRLNSTTYLLEKYKRRVEWFRKDILFKTYKNAIKNYENMLEDDLRLFLFDQGVDYPFSTPSSPSGRSDIVGEIDTDNPIIIEIKIIYNHKGYGKERIKSGFTQINKYTNDYNKAAGFLVIFNMDDREVKFINSGASILFPPSISLNNKTFYFVVINCSPTAPASKLGKLKTIEIDLGELSQS